MGHGNCCEWNVAYIAAIGFLFLLGNFSFSDKGGGGKRNKKQNNNDKSLWRDVREYFYSRHGSRTICASVAGEREKE